MSRRKPGKALSVAEKKLWEAVTRNISRLDSNRAATPLVRTSAYTGTYTGAHTGAHTGAYTLRISGPGYHFDPGRAPVVRLTEEGFTLRDADHNWHQKARRGRIKPEGRIDLHGMTGDEAYRALCHYIDGAAKRGTRVILVITGKGSRKTGGFLRNNVPGWLSRDPLAGQVTSFHSARPEDGGSGALYVVLKRHRGHGA